GPAADPRGQVTGERADGRHAGGGGGSVQHQLDEGRTDDDAVGEGGHLGGLRRVGDAEPDAHRQVGGGPGAPHQVLGVGADRLTRAGGPQQGGRVDDAAAGRGDRGRAGVPAAGRDDEDGGETVLVGVLPPQRRLLDGQVGQDAPGAARLGELGGEPLDAVAVDGVPVGHDEDRLAGGG